MFSFFFFCKMYISKGSSAPTSLYMFLRLNEMRSSSEDVSWRDGVQRRVVRSREPALLLAASGGGGGDLWQHRRHQRPSSPLQARRPRLHPARLQQGEDCGLCHTWRSSVDDFCCSKFFPDDFMCVCEQKLTAYLDLTLRTCFVIPLNTSVVLPPQDLIDLFSQLMVSTVPPSSTWRHRWKSRLGWRTNRTHKSC